MNNRKLTASGKYFLLTKLGFNTFVTHSKQILSTKRDFNMNETFFILMVILESYYHALIQASHFH